MYTRYAVNIGNISGIYREYRAIYGKYRGGGVGNPWKKAWTVHFERTTDYHISANEIAMSTTTVVGRKGKIGEL